MMKKLLPPVALFAAVFCISAFCQKYTLVQQESLGLFLWTPDFLRMVFDSPLPFSHLLGGFLVQFFKYDWLGSIITAALVTAVYLLCRSIARHLGLQASVIPMAISLLAWWLTAHSADICIVCAFVLITATLSLITLPLKGRLREKNLPRLTVFSIALVAVASVLIGTNPTVRTREEMSRVELFAVNYSWDKVLQTATPAWTEEHHDMLPFALLALNERGELGEKMYDYPIQGAQGLDTEGLNNRIAYTFSTLLYECLGCANEAIHGVYQGATYLHYGMSFRTLRQLVNYNWLLGDYALVRKYCDVLSRSTAHKAFVARYEALMASGTPREVPPVNESYDAAVMDHDQMVDLALLVSEGIFSPITMERYLCYLLARGDLETFAAQLDKVRPYYKTLPRYFQEALEFMNGGR